MSLLIKQGGLPYWTYVTTSGDNIYQFRMLICLHAPVEIVNLVSSIQVTSKALEIAGSLVSNLSDVQSSFRICNPFMPKSANINIPFGAIIHPVICWINNIEIFGSVCRETNPPAINIKRGKDKQAQIMTITPPVRNVSIHDC
jgi:hypothetical protein